MKGAAFLAARRRAILADAPGVGKTVQALAAANQVGAQQVLVVSPKRAFGVWADEIDTWLGEDLWDIYSGQNRKKDVLKGDAIFIITNYQMLSEVIRQRNHWPLIIFDESHVMRNPKLFGYTRKPGTRTAPKAHTFTHMRDLTAVYQFYLTGTPIFKGAQDLWTTLSRIDPARFPSYWSFVKRYCKSAPNYFGRGWDYFGIKDPDDLAEAVAGYMLRRRKEDVLDSLPAKQRQRVPLLMTPKQRTHYIGLAKNMMTELDDGGVLMTPSVVAMLTRLRQLLVSPRLLGIEDDGAALRALLEDLEDNPQPSVIFTPFRDAVTLVVDQLRDLGWETTFLWGGMRDDQTREVTSAFQKSHTVKRALVATVQMGTSWNAWTASQCYFLGYDWTPQVNEQAEDRLHRSGQKNAVTVRYYVHEGTVDRHVLKIVDRKETIAHLLLDHRNILDAP